MNKFLYPRCAQSFRDFYSRDKVILNRFVDKLVNVAPFDVTLRDGFQALTKQEQLNIKPIDKMNLYNKIKLKYEPKNMEIGSSVNNKLLPIFKDTEDLFKLVEKYNKQSNHYVVVPNEEQLYNTLRYGVKNFSFITSVSNSFQIKNTKMTLCDSLQNINNMMAILDDYILKVNNICDYLTKFKVKIYVSCINECPIEGKIDKNIIIENILKIMKLKPDNLCLSDTCGTISLDDFSNLLIELKKNKVDFSKLSLHLHIKPEREDEVQEIVHTAIDYGICKFDVSELETGGCSVTMDKNKIAPNMTYKQYYKFLTNYLLKE